MVGSVKRLKLESRRRVVGAAASWILLLLALVLVTQPLSSSSADVGGSSGVTRVHDDGAMTLSPSTTATSSDVDMKERKSALELSTSTTRNSLEWYLITSLHLHDFPQFQLGYQYAHVACGKTTCVKDVNTRICGCYT